MVRIRVGGCNICIVRSSLTVCPRYLERRLGGWQDGGEAASRRFFFYAIVVQLSMRRHRIGCGWVVVEIPCSCVDRSVSWLQQNRRTWQGGSRSASGMEIDGAVGRPRRRRAGWAGVAAGWIGGFFFTPDDGSCIDKAAASRPRVQRGARRTGGHHVGILSSRGPCRSENWQRRTSLEDARSVRFPGGLGGALHGCEQEP
jgi:hypothetical protein